MSKHPRYELAIAAVTTPSVNAPAAFAILCDVFEEEASGLDLRDFKGYAANFSDITRLQIRSSEEIRAISTLAWARMIIMGGNDR